MEKIIKEVLQELVSFRTEVNKQLNSMGKRLNNLDKQIDNVDKRLDNVDKRLDAVDKRLDAVEVKVTESHQWIRTLVENKDVQKAEMDNLQHKVAVVEGVLQGFDNSLEKLTSA